MSRVLVRTEESGNVNGKPAQQAKVYRDAEWDEFVVVFYAAGVRQAGADYHTSDRGDAIGTCRHHCKAAFPANQGAST